jgi:hypothetical protein
MKENTKTIIDNKRPSCSYSHMAHQRFHRIHKLSTHTWAHIFQLNAELLTMSLKPFMPSSSRPSGLAGGGAQ